MSTLSGGSNEVIGRLMYFHFLPHALSTMTPCSPARLAACPLACQPPPRKPIFVRDMKGEAAESAEDDRPNERITAAAIASLMALFAKQLCDLIVECTKTQKKAPQTLNVFVVALTTSFVLGCSALHTNKNSQRFQGVTAILAHMPTRQICD